MAKHRLKAKTRRRLQRGVVILSFLLLLVAIAVVFVLDRRVTQQTMWWGFAIFFIFEGLGLSMKKAKLKKEV